MAEQAINTVYALAERPDVFCDTLIKNLTRRAFGTKSPKEKASTPVENVEPDAMTVDDENLAAEDDQSEKPISQGANDEDKDVGDVFELSQLLFIVGHVAIKHIVFLELVEREWKRQKHEREQGTAIGSLSCAIFYALFFTLAEKAARGGNDAGKSSKDAGEELDQVAGNAEDEIGDRIALIRETELLFGPESLLATFGPMLVHICGSPPKFKVSPSAICSSRHEDTYSHIAPHSTCCGYPRLQQVPLC